MTKPKIDISQSQWEILARLLEAHLPGTRVWAFGSRAEGTARANSDLDLVVFSTPDQRRAVGDLREALEESNLPFRVDLHVWDELPARFRRRIEKARIDLQES